MIKRENERLEFLSDGIFAIAITLLVLEIKVPHLTGADNTSNLSKALLELYPSYLGYVFSFLMIGIYWANHNQIFKLYQRADRIFVLLNILFLMCIAFVPFPTAVLAEYLAIPEHRPTAITFYAVGLFLPAFSWLLIWLYASCGHRLVDEKLSNRFIRKQTVQFIITNALYLSAVLMSLWNDTAALILCVGLTMLYLLPSRKPEMRGLTDETV